MAKPNFSFQKRQKEQKRERKKQEKAQKKLDRANEALRNQADGAASSETSTDEPSRPEG